MLSPYVHRTPPPFVHHSRFLGACAGGYKLTRKRNIDILHGASGLNRGGAAAWGKLTTRLKQIVALLWSKSWQSAKDICDQHLIFVSLSRASVSLKAKTFLNAYECFSHSTYSFLFSAFPTSEKKGSVAFRRKAIEPFLSFKKERNRSAQVMTAIGCSNLLDMFTHWTTRCTQQTPHPHKSWCVQAPQHHCDVHA